jgi:predicted RNA binding protein YcfA (HicA-like mRNA interferase family)
MNGGKIPVVRPHELIRALERLGFLNTRRKGSHFRFVHPDGRRTTIPVHKGQTIGRGLLR